MKVSEYKTKMGVLLSQIDRLDERLDVQYKTTKWIIEKSEKIWQELEDEADGDHREKMLEEAVELVGRLKAEINIVNKDLVLERQVRQQFKELNQQRAKEGLEID